MDSDYVDLWLIATWECPTCGERNEEPHSITDEEEVTCFDCGDTFGIGNAYCD